MPASSVPLGPGRVQAAPRPREEAQQLPGAVWGWPPPRPVRWVPGAWDHSSEVSPAALCACVVRRSSEDGIFRSLSCEGFICPKLGLPEPPGRPPCWWPVSAHGARASSWSGGSVDLQASQPWGRCFRFPLGNQRPLVTQRSCQKWGPGERGPSGPPLWAPEGPAGRGHLPLCPQESAECGAGAERIFALCGRWLYRARATW